MSLELKQLHKRVGQSDHLLDISLTFAPGLFNVLLGSALAGKTSLLRLIAGLDQPTDGEIILQGRDITNLATRHRSIAFVYQEFVNYPTLSVFDNIASPLTVQKVARKDIDIRVAEISDLLGIGDLLRRRPTELSGGQQQRVAIARALAKDADVILLDEPLANLDYKLREELRRDLPGFLVREDKVVLYATTEAADAFLLGGQLTLLDEGQVEQCGSAQEIFARPLSRSAASLMSDVPLNLVSGRISEKRCSLDDRDSFPLPEHMATLPDGPYSLGFRAEHVKLQADSGSLLPCEVTVRVSELTGSETIVHFDYAESSCVALVEGTQAIPADRAATVFIDPDRMFVFASDGTTLATPPNRSLGQT